MSVFAKTDTLTRNFKYCASVISLAWWQNSTECYQSISCNTSHNISEANKKSFNLASYDVISSTTNHITLLLVHFPKTLTHNDFVASNGMCFQWHSIPFCFQVIDGSSTFNVLHSKYISHLLRAKILQFVLLCCVLCPFLLWNQEKRKHDPAQCDFFIVKLEFHQVFRALTLLIQVC